MINQSSNPQFEWNQNDICLLYVIYFSPSLSRGESGADCAASASVCCVFFLFFFHFFVLEISHLCSLDDLMTDPIAPVGWGGRGGGGRRGWQNVFISLPLNIAQESACALPETYGPTLVPGLVQKGFEACGLKCLRVSGGTLLHFQASAPPSAERCSDVHV